MNQMYSSGETPHCLRGEMVTKRIGDLFSDAFPLSDKACFIYCSGPPTRRPWMLRINFSSLLSLWGFLLPNILLY